MFIKFPNVPLLKVASHLEPEPVTVVGVVAVRLVPREEGKAQCTQRTSSSFSLSRGAGVLPDFTYSWRPLERTKEP